MMLYMLPGLAQGSWRRRRPRRSRELAGAGGGGEGAPLETSPDDAADGAGAQALGRAQREPGRAWSAARGGPPRTTTAASRAPARS